MKLLLAFPGNIQLAVGGGAKATLYLMERLAARGHSCEIVDGGADESSRRAFIAAMGAWRGEVVDAPRAVTTRRSGLSIHSCSDGARFCMEVLDRVERFQPDWVIVTQDRTFNVVRLLAERARERTVLIAHASQMLPLGPGSWVGRDERKMELLHQVRGIVTVSRYLKDYIARWGKADAEVLTFPSYGEPPFPDLTNTGEGPILMVNPCAIKGIDVLVGLAEALPGVAFRAIPTWGATPGDLAALRSRPNIELGSPSDDIDRVLTGAKAVLVPSLYDEAFGQIAVDAMLRGLPVLASNTGGLPEAKLGVEYVIPVNAIEEYRSQLSESLATMPAPVVPPQDVRPWVRALKELEEPTHYADIARRSREAATTFVNSIDVAHFERYFTTLGRTAGAR